MSHARRNSLTRSQADAVSGSRWRVSGPHLERIGAFVEVTPVEYEKLVREIRFNHIPHSYIDCNPQWGMVS